jgi:hypothetical protein
VFGDDHHSRDERRALRDLEVAEAVELLGITALAAKIEALIGAFTQFKETLMATVEQLTADFTTYQGDVTTAIAAVQTNVTDLTATVTDLKNQLANVQIPPAAQAAIDNLDAQVQAADANLKAVPTPAPVEQPPAAPTV